MSNPTRSVHLSYSPINAVNALELHENGVYVQPILANELEYALSEITRLNQEATLFRKNVEDEVEELVQCLRQCEEENNEQALLLGKSGCREAALLAKIDKLKKGISHALPDLRHLYGHMVNGRIGDSKAAATGLLGRPIAMLEMAVNNVQLRSDTNRSL